MSFHGAQFATKPGARSSRNWLAERVFGHHGGSSTVSCGWTRLFLSPLPHVVRRRGIARGPLVRAERQPGEQVVDHPACRWREIERQRLGDPDEAELFQLTVAADAATGAFGLDHQEPRIEPYR